MMNDWLLRNSVWNLLHDPDLRRPAAYMISRRTTTASGRSTSVIRLLCCVIVVAIGLSVVGTGDSAWWLAVAVLPFAGSVLAILHTREEIIAEMMNHRARLVRALGRRLTSGAWTRLNLPGVLETLGPLVMVWMIGEPAGPFTGHPAAQTLAAASTLLYSALGTLHWAIDSVFYQPESTKAWSVSFARLARAVVPLLLGGVYGYLLSRNTDTATAGLPWLALCFLLLYPAVVFFEKSLTSALVEIEPAVIAQRLRDATVVHSSISNPLHFVLMAARRHPAGDAEALLIYLRTELDRCRDELDNQHPPATVGQIVEGVRNSLLPEDRTRLLFDEPDTAALLSPVDASLVRSVLADLCCNALKEVRGDRLPTATVTTDQKDTTITLQVTDDGSGMTEEWHPGTSLGRLRKLLVQLDGGLTFRPTQPSGTTATASWRTTPAGKAV
jgi:signal transduction histidine kinase